MKIPGLPVQPHPVLSFLKVGRLLHQSLILFIMESWVFWLLLKSSIEDYNMTMIIIWSVCFLFSFLHIFLVVMDGWSRFQDYKKVKDLFFIHGFDRRIAEHYIGSKCQRSAALVAAEELGIQQELKTYYQSRGVKWFHFIPYFMVMDPLFLFRKTFWQRTFLEKKYTAKFDYRRLKLESYP